MFAADVNRCCLVVQVAAYPKKDEPLELSLFDFSLVEVNADKPVRPESPTTIAARLEKKKNPPGGVDVATSGGVGYESGTYIDPVTGQPVHVRPSINSFTPGGPSHSRFRFLRSPQYPSGKNNGADGFLISNSAQKNDDLVFNLWVICGVDQYALCGRPSL